MTSSDYFVQGASLTGTGTATIIAGINNTGNPGNVDYFYQNYGTVPWNEQTIDSGCC